MTGRSGWPSREIRSVLVLLALFVSSPPTLTGQALVPGPPAATIWYLGHSGYAVRTATKLLIFDYSEKLRRKTEQPPPQPSLSNGWINPEEIQDLDVVVFVSHDHSDHHDAVIRTWQTRVHRIAYVYGWKVPDAPNVHSVAGPRSELTLGNLEVSTVNDHHDDTDEVAFLVQVDGLSIFHNGDYMGQRSPGGPFTYKDDLRFLKTRAASVDLLFSMASTVEPYPQIIRALAPRTIVPMHALNREAKYAEFARGLETLGIHVPVLLPTRPGDRFEYRQGGRR